MPFRPLSARALWGASVLLVALPAGASDEKAAAQCAIDYFRAQGATAAPQVIADFPSMKYSERANELLRTRSLIPPRAVGEPFDAFDNKLSAFVSGEAASSLVMGQGVVLMQSPLGGPDIGKGLDSGDKDRQKQAAEKLAQCDGQFGFSPVTRFVAPPPSDYACAVAYLQYGQQYGLSVGENARQRAMIATQLHVQANPGADLAAAMQKVQSDVMGRQSHIIDLRRSEREIKERIERGEGDLRDNQKELEMLETLITKIGVEVGETITACEIKYGQTPPRPPRQGERPRPQGQ